MNKKIKKIINSTPDWIKPMIGLVSLPFLFVATLLCLPFFMLWLLGYLVWYEIFEQK